MEGFENFHFLRPMMFLLLIPLLWLLYKLKTKVTSLSAWQKVCDPALLSYLKVGVETKSSQRSFWLLGLSSVLIMVALAGPVWKQLPQPMYREQSSLVVLLDLSRSMDSGDLKPSRLIRAKQKLTDLLKLRREGQTALVVFAGSAFVVTPLTDDHETILSQLQSLSSDMMPKQGGDISSALEKAEILFQQASVRHGDILALTDSEQFDLEVVKRLSQAGHRIHVIGVGTKGGAPIAKAEGGFLTDQRGNIVIPQLDEGVLRGLVSLGNGVYQRLSLDDSDLRATLSNTSQKIWQDSEKETGQVSDQWQEEGPWLLLLLIPVALMGFRRGMLVVTLFLCLPTPEVEAGIWQDLWQTNNQQGEALMAQKQYEQASSIFDDSAWKASAAYRDGNFERVLQAINNIDKPSLDDLYNKGNALAQLGKPDEAIKAYDEVLKLEPTHQDALANKNLLEKLKQEQSDKNQEKKEQEKNKQDEKGKVDNQQQQNTEQQKSDGEQGNQDSEQQQSEKGDGQQNKNQQPQEQKDSDNPDSKQQQAKQDNQGAVDKEKEAQAKQQAEQANQEEGLQDKQMNQVPSADDLEKTEASQAFEQTLRRVPDDPGGLLRRKFLYQYKQQGAPQPLGEQLW
ncbi:MAG: VWA domain-containing protein [Ghiorsea sp.]